MVDDRSSQDDRPKRPETGSARPVLKKDRLSDRVGNAISERFLKNPLAWFLLALLVVAEYWNYEHLKQLDTVCEAIPYADLLPYNPKTDLEKAQVICEGRQESPHLPDE
jgi:hypothetical protein